MDLLIWVIIAALAVLSLTGLLPFWELMAIVALYGVGTAFFTPAFEAIVPDIVPAADLAAANGGMFPRAGNRHQQKKASRIRSSQRCAPARHLRSLL